jgi:hypothetical protein
LGYSLIDARARSGPTKAYARVCTSNSSPDAGYVFLADPQPKNEPYEEYRRVRVSRLLAYCKVATLRAPIAKHIVGIAFDAPDPNKKGGSEDLVYLDVAIRTTEMEAEARQIQAEFGLLLDENVQAWRFHGNEYPDETGIGLRPMIDRSLERRKERQQAKVKKRNEKLRKDSRRRNRRGR